MRATGWWVVRERYAASQRLVARDTVVRRIYLGVKDRCTAVAADRKETHIMSALSTASTMSSYAQNLAAASLVEQISVAGFYATLFVIAPALLVFSSWRDNHPRRGR